MRHKFDLRRIIQAKMAMYLEDGTGFETRVLRFYEN